MSNIAVPFQGNTHEFCRAVDAWVRDEHEGNSVGGMLAFDADNNVIDERVYFIGSLQGTYDLPYGDGPEAAADTVAWIKGLGDDCAYVMTFHRRAYIGVPLPPMPTIYDINLVDASNMEAERDGYVYRGHLIIGEFTEGVILDPDDERLAEAQAEGLPIVDMDAESHGHDHGVENDAGRELLRRLESKLDQPEQGHAAEPTDLPRIEIPKAFLN